MPSNTSAATATAITSLPYSITVDPDGASQVLWWKYTAPVGAVAVGLFAWADDAGAYRPRLHVWRGSDPSSLTDDTPLESFEAERKPCVLPVNDGETYYFAIEDANGTEPLGAPLEFSVLPAPASRVRVGDLFIPDDTPGPTDSIGWFPASVSDPATGEVRRLAVFPACERGEILPTGEILAVTWSSGDGWQVALYSHRLELVTKISGVITSLSCSIRSDNVATFYVYDGATDTLSTVSRTGVVGGTTWSPSTSARAIAVSRDGSVLYYSEGPSLSAGLYRWDLVGNTSLGLIAGSNVTNYFIREDVYVLPDDTVLVGYAKTSATADYFVRRYAADGSGTVLNTYSLGTEKIERIALGADQESFVIYNNDASSGSGVSRFTFIRVSDGAVLDTWDRVQCNAGFIAVPTPIEDAPRFSHSFSCPFLILRQNEVVTLIDESVPCCESECACPPSPVGTPSGSPSSGPVETSTGPVLPPVNIVPETGAPTPLDPSYWERLCAGGGTVPEEADPTDYESWVRH